MGWKTEIIDPQDPVAPKRRMDEVCPPLCRFFGMVCFSAVGVGVTYLGCRWMSIPGDFWMTGNLSGKAIALVAVALVLAFIGMAVGLDIGASIPVRTEKANYILSVAWHYLANGTILWGVLISMVLTKVVGREQARAFLQDFGEWRFGWWMFGLASSLALGTGALLLATGQLKPSVKPDILLCWLFGLPVALATAWWHFSILKVETRWWILVGVLFPLGLISASGWTMQRDQWQRERLQAGRTTR